MMRHQFACKAKCLVIVTALANIMFKISTMLRKFMLLHCIQLAVHEFLKHFGDFSPLWPDRIETHSSSTLYAADKRNQ